MKISEMKKKAEKLLELNSKIKHLEEEADKLKKELRLVMPEDGIQLKNDFICKKVSTTTPVFDNKKLYSNFSFEELLKVTKPVVGEMRKILKDEYDEVVDSCAIRYETIECIRFFCGRKK